MPHQRDPRPPQSDEPEKEDDADDGSYAEEHVDGRLWVEFSTTSNSRTYAMEIYASGDLVGSLVRTTSWGDDGEFASTSTFIPKVNLVVLQSEPEE